MCADPQSAKNIVKLSVFFALLGSARIKAASKMLVKSTPMDLVIYFTWLGVFGVRRAAGILVSDDEESVRTFSVVDKVANHQRRLVL